MNRAQRIVSMCNESIRELEAIKADAETVAHRVECDSFGGLPSGSGEEKRRSKGGFQDGPTPVLGRQLRDDVAANWKAFVAALGGVKTAALQASLAKSRLKAISLEEAQRLIEQSNPAAGKYCDNPACGRWVANTRADRIRAGRCPACYEYRRTHEGRDRPKELIEPSQEQDVEGLEGPAPEFYRDLHAVRGDVA